MTTYLFSLMVGAMASPALADSSARITDQPIHRFVLVGHLQELCGGENQAQCSGYLLGVVDTANSILVAQSKPEAVCPPDGVGDEELVASVKRNLAAAKMPPDYGAPTAIIQWLGQDYPCK